MAELTISAIRQRTSRHLGLSLGVEEPIAKWRPGVPFSGVVTAQDSLSCTIPDSPDRARASEVINTPDIETGIPAYSNA